MKVLVVTTIFLVCILNFIQAYRPQLHVNRTQEGCPGRPTFTKVVLCYYEGRAPAAQLDPCLCSHLVLTNAASFPNGSSKSSIAPMTLDSNLVSAVTSLKRRNPELLVLGRVTGGARAALTTSRGAEVAAALAALVRNNGLDGLEVSLDWEGARVAGGAHGKQRLVSLVKGLRVALQSTPEGRGRRQRRSYSVREEIEDDVPRPSWNSGLYIRSNGSVGVQTTTTTTAPPSTKPVEQPAEPLLLLQVSAKPGVLGKRFDLKPLAKYVDYFTVPTHNLTDDSENGVTYHQSRLMGLSDILNTDSVLDLLTGLGAPASRLIMTFPAAGLRFQLQNTTLNKPRSPALAPPQLVSHQEVCQLLLEGGWMVERDEDLTAPYAFRGNSWIAFDDELSVEIKGKYALLRELAGVAVWALDDDDLTNACGRGRSSLTRAMASTLVTLARRPRSVVLQSLMEPLAAANNAPQLVPVSRPTRQISLSPYRVVRVVDRAGAVHVLRRDAQTEFECSRQGYYVHPQGCDRFYRCVKFDQRSDDYSVFEYDCPSGLAFDEKWEVCMWPGQARASCAGSSEIRPVPRNKFACSTPGYYADPENCRWFFACMDHRRDGSELSSYEFRCPFGLGFDERNLMCNWPWLVPNCAGSYSDSSAKLLNSGSLSSGIGIDQFLGINPSSFGVNTNAYIGDEVSRQNQHISTVSSSSKVLGTSNRHLLPSVESSLSPNNPSSNAFNNDKNKYQSLPIRTEASRGTTNYVPFEHVSNLDSTSSIPLAGVKSNNNEEQVNYFPPVVHTIVTPDPNVDIFPQPILIDNNNFGYSKQRGPVVGINYSPRPGNNHVSDAPVSQFVTLQKDAGNNYPTPTRRPQLEVETYNYSPAQVPAQIQTQTLFPIGNNRHQFGDPYQLTTVTESIPIIGQQVSLSQDTANKYQSQSNLSPLKSTTKLANTDSVQTVQPNVDKSVPISFVNSQLQEKDYPNGPPGIQIEIPAENSFPTSNSALTGSSIIGDQEQKFKPHLEQHRLEEQRIRLEQKQRDEIRRQQQERQQQQLQQQQKQREQQILKIQQERERLLLEQSERERLLHNLKVQREQEQQEQQRRAQEILQLQQERQRQILKQLQEDGERQNLQNQRERQQQHDQKPATLQYNREEQSVKSVDENDGHPLESDFTDSSNAPPRPNKFNNVEFGSRLPYITSQGNVPITSQQSTVTIPNSEDQVINIADLQSVFDEIEVTTPHSNNFFSVRPTVAGRPSVSDITLTARPVIPDEITEEPFNSGFISTPPPISDDSDVQSLIADFNSFGSTTLPILVQPGARSSLSKHNRNPARPAIVQPSRAQNFATLLDSNEGFANRNPDSIENIFSTTQVSEINNLGENQFNNLRNKENEQSILPNDAVLQSNQRFAGQVNQNQNTNSGNRQDNLDDDTNIPLVNNGQFFATNNPTITSSAKNSVTQTSTENSFSTTSQSGQSSLEFTTRRQNAISRNNFLSRPDVQNNRDEVEAFSIADLEQQKLGEQSQASNNPNRVPIQGSVTARSDQHLTTDLNNENRNIPNRGSIRYSFARTATDSQEAISRTELHNSASVKDSLTSSSITDSYKISTFGGSITDAPLYDARIINSFDNYRIRSSTESLKARASFDDTDASFAFADSRTSDFASDSKRRGSPNISNSNVLLTRPQTNTNVEHSQTEASLDSSLTSDSLEASSASKPFDESKSRSSFAGSRSRTLNAESGPRSSLRNSDTLRDSKLSASLNSYSSLASDSLEDSSASKPFDESKSRSSFAGSRSRTLNAESRHRSSLRNSNPLPDSKSSASLNYDNIVRTRVISRPIGANSLPLVEKLEGATSVGTGRKFDRYGPGGWRSANETLGPDACSREGLFRHPKDCNKFYECFWDSWKERYTLHIFNCPIRLAYDPSISACNWPVDGPGCSGNRLLLHT